MRYNVLTTKNFEKDVDKAKKRGFDIVELEDIVDQLRFNIRLEPKYKDHSLKGKYKGCRECHIKPDWLLIYKKIKDELVLLLLRTGTHDELF